MLDVLRVPEVFWLTANKLSPARHRLTCSPFLIVLLYVFRFYFLSNDELLEILAEAKDPLAVQPFVKKCFEAVKELIFEGGKITGLISAEGEKVTFDQQVDPIRTGNEIANSA